MKTKCISLTLASILVFTSLASANSISEIFIHKGIFHSGGPDEYWLEIGIDGEDIKSATFSCDGVGAGNLDYYAFEDEWYFEDESFAADFFDAYPNGNFDISVTFNDDEVRIYDVDFQHLMPAQIPVITYPGNLQLDVENEPTFTWEAVNDPLVNAIWPWLDNATTGEILWEPDMPYFDTTMVFLDSPVTLPDDWIFFGLAFANGESYPMNDPVTGAYIDVLTSASSETEILFSTVPEPGVLVTAAAGLVALCGIVRRKFNK